MCVFEKKLLKTGDSRHNDADIIVTSILTSHLIEKLYGVIGLAQYGFDGRVVDHVGQSVGTDEQEVVIEKSVGEVFYDQSPIASPADAVEEIFVGVGIAGEAPWGLIDGELPEVREVTVELMLGVLRS